MAEGQFFDKLFSGAHGKAAEQEALYQKQRDEDTAMYMQVLHDPAASREQRQRAADAIGKLRNLKKGENPYHGISDFLSNLSEHIQKRDSSTAPQPQSLPQVQGPTSTSTGSAPGDRPNGLPPLTAEGPRVGLGKRMLGAAAKGLGGVMRGVENVSASMAGFNSQTPKPSDLPPIDVSAFPDSSQYFGKAGKTITTPDGTVLQEFQQYPGGPVQWIPQYDANGQPVKQHGYQRPFSQGDTSLADAKKQAANGTTFNDENGQPIDLDKLPADMKLMAFRRDDKTYYKPVSAKQKTFTAGGRTYGVTEFGILDITDNMNAGNGTAVDLGAKNPPKTTTRETPGVDAQGNPVTNVMHTTTTPGAPWIPGVHPNSPTQPAKPGDPPATSGNRKNLPAVTTGGGAEHKQPVKGAGGSAKGGPEGGRPLYPTAASWNQAQTRVVPVREAAAQLFGDPQLPNVRSLASFAKIADDPAASQRVGTSVKLILDGINADINKSGGLWTYMETVGGLPGLMAAAKNNQVYQNLPPGSDEQAAVDAIISSFSTAVGLRSLTKASAAQASVEKIENDIPIPGFNVKSSKQYYDKLGRLAVVVDNGMKSLPDYAMSQADKQYYRDRMNDYTSKGLNSGNGKKGLTPIKPTPSRQDLEQGILDAVQRAKGSAGGSTSAPR